MKNIKLYIQEVFKVGAKTKINSKLSFTTDELRKDYQEVGGAYTKAEKKFFCDKYGILTNKIRDIQIEILNYLRENRNKKKEYDIEDVKDFIRYDLPEKYDKLEVYLQEETDEFIKCVLDYYKDKGKKINMGNLSANDRYILKRISQFEKYINNL